MPEPPAVSREPPLPLFASPAEPTPALEDPPAILQESVDAKLMKVLNQLPRERRKVIFNRFGYYTQNALLRNISNTQKATKGNL